ncbi:hypothetical protein ABZ990_25010 [Streptomyces sp. NPDC046203]|uniref:hypothetical protein n=1 Tax=Streptomyces sp. NPDC046203 TaxID=3154602 RepID=UPI0033C79ED1
MALDPEQSATGRRRVLVAPVTVTPSKPLTPSHLKGLLWADAMSRATAAVADVTFRYSPTSYHRTEQTLGFWEFVDRTQGDTDYAELSAEQVGELYVRYRAAGERPSAEALRPYADAVEQGWVHPSSARVLALWAEEYARLGLRDPGLERHQPPRFGLDEMVERLCAAGLGIDQRSAGGPVYLDATRYGLPLRRIVTSDGRPNYLACALRELLPLAPDFDEVVLLYDRELDPDYQLLERVFTACGTAVRRVPIGRVPVDGRILSARHGGWQGHTAGALLDAAEPGHSPSALRLGMRLYFIAGLGPGEKQSFRKDLLHHAMGRAERLLDGAAARDGGSAGPLAEAVRRHRRDHLYVDPYRLTSSLLGRGRPAPDPELLTAVYL